jgi:hypothetical protein
MSCQVVYDVDHVILKTGKFLDLVPVDVKADVPATQVGIEKLSTLVVLQAVALSGLPHCLYHLWPDAPRSSRRIPGFALVPQQRRSSCWSRYFTRRWMSAVLRYPLPTNGSYRGGTPKPAEIKVGAPAGCFR